MNKRNSRVWLLWAVLGYVMLALIGPYYALRALLARNKKHSIYWQQKLARYDFMPETQPLIWIHAVSVGELFTVKPLLKALKQHYPEFYLLVSSGTLSAYQLAENMTDIDQAIAFPIDAPSLCKKSLQRFRPALVIILETEIWPNFIRAVKRQNIPLVLLNARLDDRAYRHYYALLGFFAPVIKSYNAILAQSEADRERFRRLSADEANLHCLGNLKYAAAVDSSDSSARDDWRTTLQLLETDIALIAGSTFPGEEQCLAKIFRSFQQQQLPLKLVLAPRHLHRVPQICRELRALNLQPLLRSELNRQSQQVNASIIVIDTMGELAQLYAAADIVFIGKSLYAQGGQNPLEAAAWGKAIVFGPYMQNFQEISTQLLQQQAAVCVRDAEELNTVLLTLTTDQLQRQTLATNAYQLVQNQQNQDILQNTMAMLAPYLKI